MIGNKYVLLRFMYIEIWVAIIVNKLGLIEDKARADIIQTYLDDINVISKYETVNKDYFGIHYPGIINKLKYSNNSNYSF